MAENSTTKTLTAGGAISAFRIVKPDAVAGQVLQAAAATDKLFGVCVNPSGAASGARIDVDVEGIAMVEFGGTVAAGDPITADANGKAVLAAPAAGVNNRIIGFAFEAAVSGDISRVVLGLGQIQG